MLKAEGRACVCRDTEEAGKHVRAGAQHVWRGGPVYRVVQFTVEGEQEEAFTNSASSLPRTSGDRPTDMLGF